MRGTDERQSFVARHQRAFIMCAVAACWMFLLARHVDRLHVSALAGVTLLTGGWLCLRMLFAAGNRPVETTEFWDDALGNLRVVVVVPFYNEDPEYFARCLYSITRQTRPPDAVWLIDDASRDPRCLQIAKNYARATSNFSVHVVRADVNAGKRHAQAYAFRQEEADVWLTCDSDTILAADAIEEGLKPFRDRRVYAVAGLTIGHNWKRNVLTRIIDIEFVNSFLIGRASTSRFGSVLVACGTIAFYRDKVVREHLDDYLNETFCGRPVRAGDDRRLTQYALLHGRTVFQETSVAYTALPEKFGHLVRQRVRWSSSFYRGVSWVAQNIGVNRVAYWLVALQLVELVFVLAMLVSLFVHSTRVGVAGLLAYFTYMTFLSYIRCLRYLTYSRADMTMRDKFTSVALAPLISLLYTFVLHPVRWYAILKSTDAKWGTRTQVEVSIRPDAARDATRPAAERRPSIRPPAVPEPAALVRSGA
jgi:hyaluronan synthase